MANTPMPTEIFIEGNGRMAKQMEKGITFIIKEENI